MDLLNRVKKDIIKNNLISEGEKVLIALSGGSDSVCMLYILKELSKKMNFSLCAAHVNHNLRQEAKDDELFVKNLCEKMGIECYILNTDIESYSKELKISCELAGRKKRYEFFNEIKEKYNIDKIATAHNKNDSLESIMLHFIRGCAIDGLSGIPAVRNGYIIRPILNLTKKEIEDYCRENSIEFVVDKTNFTTDYTRNKIRLELIPYIEKELNPGFINTVTSNAVTFSETAEFLNKIVEDKYKNIVKDYCIDTELLMSEDIVIVKLVIQKMYREFTKSEENISNKNIESIVEMLRENKTSKTVNICNNISARIEFGKLFFNKTKNGAEEYDYPVSVNIPIEIDEIGYSILIKKEEEIKKDKKNKIYFYVDKTDGLHIRNRRVKDKFKPTGMMGTKNISDLFCDLKISSDMRKKIPILMLDDDIIWVVGIRKDRRFNDGKILMSAEIIERRNNG